MRGYLGSMISRPYDTTPAAWTAQNAALERMGGGARVQAAIELSEAVREIRLRGIADRNPELDRRGVIARLIREEYGVELPESL